MTASNVFDDLNVADDLMACHCARVNVARTGNLLLRELAVENHSALGWGDGKYEEKWFRNDIPGGKDATDNFFL